MSPKLNREGKLTCTINNSPAFCEFDSERFVKVWPTKTLTKAVAFYLGIYHVS